MSDEAHEELLNVYDPEGRITGVMPRREAKGSGLAVGAVNALVFNGRGELLMQRRPPDKENGGLWDKSVGGHVSAGETFDETIVREAGEELFDDARSARIRLCGDAASFASARLGEAPKRGVLLRALDRRLNLRDVRRLPGGGVRTVVYHVAIYAGFTELPLAAFKAQADEVAELRFVGAERVDLWLLECALAPNMAFLWLTQAGALLGR